MIIIDLKAVLYAKQQEWQRNVTLKEISEKTGISRMTLHRMIKHPGYNACTDHLDRLCHFFNCDISTLIHWQPNLVATRDEA